MNEALVGLPFEPEEFWLCTARYDKALHKLKLWNHKDVLSDNYRDRPGLHRELLEVHPHATDFTWIGPHVWPHKFVLQMKGPTDD